MPRVATMCSAAQPRSPLPPHTTTPPLTMSSSADPTNFLIRFNPLSYDFSINNVPRQLRKEKANLFPKTVWDIKRYSLEPFLPAEGLSKKYDWTSSFILIHPHPFSDRKPSQAWPHELIWGSLLLDEKLMNGNMSWLQPWPSGWSDGHRILAYLEIHRSVTTLNCFDLITDLSARSSLCLLVLPIGFRPMQKGKELHNQIVIHIGTIIISLPLSTLNTTQIYTMC